MTLNKENQFVNTAKGILILLVILGHFVKGDISSNLIRYVIYGFHMPLFFGISGFLFNKSSLTLPLSDFILKYKKIMIPWVLAFAAYNLYFFILGGQFVGIYYHLWYIPAFLFFVLIYRLIKEINIPDVVILSIYLSIYRIKLNRFIDRSY